MQGLYVLALAMGLVPEDKKKQAAGHLARKVAENQNCLDTCFMSIKFLMDVLTEHGLAEKHRRAGACNRNQS